MAKLSREAVLKLAHLSRLKLTDEEVERFRTELSEILEYVEQLDNVDTTSLEPTYQTTGLTTVVRKDEKIDYQAKPEDLLKQAPAVKDGQFKVKRVLD
jgi:aspartyl-tRNA(Asn)/glutamyl-tRNA(Gln) amidotransferase subunit C